MVEDLEQANLEVSDVTLEEDWERGDIFISEFSLSVIDAMRKGKLGFFANFTNRRSFMEDYVTLGFPLVRNQGEMVTTIRDMLTRPQDFAKQQNAAMENYNSRLTTFLNEPL